MIALGGWLIIWSDHHRKGVTQQQTMQHSILRGLIVCALANLGKACEHCVSLSCYFADQIQSKTGSRTISLSLFHTVFEFVCVWSNARKGWWTRKHVISTSAHWTTTTRPPGPSSCGEGMSTARALVLLTNSCCLSTLEETFRAFLFVHSAFKRPLLSPVWVMLYL